MSDSNDVQLTTDAQLSTDAQLTSLNDFTSTELYSEIESASEKHKNQQLNFRFKAPEMLKLLNHLQKTPETEKLIESVFKDALDKSDKRPMTEQLNLKAKYQKSHGLVFKDIPTNVQRHIIFDAILKLGRTMDFESGRLAFPGGCKLRSFFFPQIKHREQQHRVCFPIFVNKRDQMFIYQWAQNQNGKIQLDVDGKCGWDGVVSVELTRDAAVDDDDAVSVVSGVSGGGMSGVSRGGMSGFSSFKGFDAGFKRYDGFGNPVQNPMSPFNPISQSQLSQNPLSQNPLAQNPLAQNPLAQAFSPQNPYLPFLPFTHGGPVTPAANVINHPNLIAHQNMMNSMNQSPVLTATTTPTVQSKTDDVTGTSLNSLSLKDSEYSPSATPELEVAAVEPIC